MRDARIAADGEVDQLATVDAENRDDPVHGVVDRAVDIGRRQIDESRREIGQEPLELHEADLGIGNVQSIILHAMSDSCLR